MDNEKEFFEKIAPELEGLEALRFVKRAVYKKRLWVAIILTPIVVGVLGALIFGNGLDARLFFVPAGGLVFFAIFYVRKPLQDYKAAYKNKVLPKIANLFGGFTYRQGQGIPVSELIPSKIMPLFDRYRGEDRFEGGYKETRINFSEILLKKKISGKNNNYATVFKGVAVLLEVPKQKFLGHTILTPDRMSFFGFGKEGFKGLDRADLVDADFEDKYDVYTNDQVEARYLIDPLMVEKLRDLAETLGVKKVSAAWYDNRMLILIASKKNYFEPAPIGVAATESDTIRLIYHELAAIMGIIDHLDYIDKKRLAEG